MLRRSIITNITPLPATISRGAAVAQLHDHAAMIELNPLVIRHVTTEPPSNASRDEADNATWYEITDRINYLPGGAMQGEVSYKACFYDLPHGLQTHVFAPAGVDIRSKWSVEGSLPGEPKQPVELGVDLPREGLYIREDVDLRCNILMIGFVKRNLKKSHHVVAEKIVEQAAEKQKLGGFPVKRPDSATRPLENEIPSNPYRQVSPLPPVRTHYSFPAHCACETSQHHLRCPHYQAASPTTPSIRRGYTSDFHVSSQTSPYTLASVMPLSPIHYPELYGSPPADRCLCTGALHAEGCASYPGLRMAPGSATPNSILATPASFYVNPDTSVADNPDLSRHGDSTSRPHHDDPAWRDSDDLPNAFRPQGTMQFVHELEADPF